LGINQPSYTSPTISCVLPRHMHNTLGHAQQRLPHSTTLLKLVGVMLGSCTARRLCSGPSLQNSINSALHLSTTAVRSPPLHHNLPPAKKMQESHRTTLPVSNLNQHKYDTPLYYFTSISHPKPPPRELLPDSRSDEYINRQTKPTRSGSNSPL